MWEEGGSERCHAHGVHDLNTSTCVWFLQLHACFMYVWMFVCKVTPKEEEKGNLILFINMFVSWNHIISGVWLAKLQRHHVIESMLQVEVGGKLSPESSDRQNLSRNITVFHSANPHQVFLRAPPETSQSGGEYPVIVLHTCFCLRVAPPSSLSAEGGPEQRKQVTSVAGRVIDGFPENEGQRLKQGIC